MYAILDFRTSKTLYCFLVGMGHYIYILSETSDFIKLLQCMLYMTTDNH